MTRRTAKDAALLLLSRREHSARELAQKLRQRDFTTDDITAAITALQDANFISDHRFACAFIRANAARTGDRLLRLKLKQHNLSDEQIADAFNSESPPPESARAARLIAQKYRHPTDKNKIARFLYSRGFSHDSVTATIDGGQRPLADAAAQDLDHLASDCAGGDFGDSFDDDYADDRADQ